jgi:tricorn protease interacting factor F2/3
MENLLKEFKIIKIVDTNPINYQLTFEPDLKKFTFSGTEIITVSCKKSTNKITMHCAELKIKSCIVKSADTIIASISKTNEKKEELSIKLSKRIKGVATISLEFQGILNDRLLGFYRSQYKQNGKIKYLATTQFEAADARRAFPCWDEPEAKATFEISIIADNKFTAISNMPVISKKKIKNKTLYKFGKTPVVSTYLIYLGVGEFEYLTGKTGKVQIRVITTKGNKSKGKYSLDLGKKLLTSYEKYFGIKYPLPKLDLIAIPDFAAGAMENWGAITFRETILLYDPKTSSTRTKQFIAEVISHEIAHQWFGNLVTMKWWNDLWLNESFATFMATKFVDKFYPEWNLWDQFIEDAMNTAMGLDSLKTTHPIDVTVNSPAEIREIFDAISYDKGGCVLRMLENYVGETNFRTGLKNYLSTFKYGNAQGQDLWDAIGKASKMPVSAMVNSWLKQPGFPQVEITQNDKSLVLKQSRFLMEPTPKTQKGLWHIPITLGLGNETVTKLITKKSITVKTPSSPGFVANIGRTGFYRVKYDDGILLDLKMLVDQKQIPHVDRWAIQNDLFALCIAGKEDVANYLDFTDAYFDEDSYLPQTNVANNLNFLASLTFFEDFGVEIREYAINYFRKILSNLGWMPKKSDKHTDAFLRGVSIFVLGKFGDDLIIEQAEIKFKAFLKNPSTLHPDIREAIFSLVAWNGNAKTHSQFVTLYKKAKTMEEKLRFLGAMCNFRNEKLLIKTLQFSQTSEVRSQNMQLPIMKIASNPYGKNILWPWLKKNWGKMSKKVGYGNPLFNRIVASITLVADDSMESDIKAFFKKNPTPGTERTQTQTLEKIRIYSNLLRKMEKEFKQNG